MHADKASLKPWSDDEAQRFLRSFGSWKKLTELVRGSLQQEVTEYPHQIRAAASLVIMLCRPGLWPGQEIRELDEVVDLARRQLVLVKSYFTSESRVRSELRSNPAFKQLMISLEYEIRILESRMSDPPLLLPQKPPPTWGDFWS